MIVHKCDRCGAIYEKSPFLSEDHLEYKIKKWGFFQDSSVELCPFCTEGLHSFLMEGDYFKAEEERRKGHIAADKEAQKICKLIRRK